MTSFDIESVCRRLERLERQNRNLRRCLQGVGIILVAGTALAWSAAPTVTDVVSARAFHVVDDAGRVRARLGSSEGTAFGSSFRFCTVGLQIYAKNDTKCIDLTHTDRSPEMWDDFQTVTQLVFGTTDGNDALALRSNADRAGLAVFRPNTPSITKQHETWEALDPAKRGEFIAKTNKLRRTPLLFVGRVAHDVSPSPDLADRLLALDVEPVLEFADSEGRMRAVLGPTALDKGDSGVVEKRPVSSLVLFNEAGNVTWKAP
jgi:hypothetical protein